MGLDITAYTISGGSSQIGRGERFHTWRKHHALADWLSELDIERGEQAWEEPAHSIGLTIADLDRLESAVLNRELADRYVTDDSNYWVDDDLEFIAKARAALASGFDVEIIASW